MDLKKEIYLGIAAVALYAAAREYGIHSLADAKRKLGPYMKWIDVIDALTSQNEPRRKPTQALQSRGNQVARTGQPAGHGRTPRNERSHEQA